MTPKPMLLGIGLVAGVGAALFGSTRTDAALSAEEARAIATDAYLYGYPLVTSEMTKRVSTNVASPSGTRAPLGQYVHLRNYPTPEMKDVTTPNADTLYSVAWVDLSNEPYVVGIPDMKGRYFMLPMLDAWSEVFEVPGSRTTGTGPQTYGLVGPGFKGKLPPGMTEYRSPTNLVWILGRIYSKGTPEDLAEVHALQDQLTLVPLSFHGKNYMPPTGIVDPTIDMKTPVRDQVDKMDAATFFGVMAEAMKANPPTKADRPMIERMAKIGIAPGAPFEVSRLPSDAAKALDDVPKLAREKMIEHIKKHAGRIDNHWIIANKLGQYGTDYVMRAATALAGFGANRPADAIYPATTTDSDGQPLDANAHAYVLHFDKDKEPPVKGFWSLTMYTPELYFVPNELKRYSLGNRSNMRRNADGSLDIYLQKDNPGADKEDNWLPAPDGKFRAVLRLYWPNEAPPTILDGSWKPPAITRVR